MPSKRWACHVNAITQRSSTRSDPSELWSSTRPTSRRRADPPKHTTRPTSRRRADQAKHLTRPTLRCMLWFRSSEVLTWSMSTRCVDRELPTVEDRCVRCALTPVQYSNRCFRYCSRVPLKGIGHWWSERGTTKCRTQTEIVGDLRAWPVVGCQAL